jgi:hypothetical protein
MSLLQPNGLSDVVVYQCRVVDYSYKEIFNEILSEDEKNIFIGIMSSDKEALLYRTHPKFQSLAMMKIDEYTKETIPDGTRWP